uniref:putative disease resistance RPP13-like protein 1 n=1 Tax=Erigeron canadensis TaxID=72917 RepID=UPI001CB98311|nr:putative disease resistance RPP13-like protein 1 [Erigeron canadensis]
MSVTSSENWFTGKMSRRKILCRRKTSSPEFAGIPKNWFPVCHRKKRSPQNWLAGKLIRRKKVATKTASENGLRDAKLHARRQLNEASSSTSKQNHGFVYNDKKVKDHFELKSWVCVSDEFDVFNISKTIYKDVGGDDKLFETLNQLQVALAEKLSKKRFLIVLDDVWNEDYHKWELQHPFIVGAPGSKIIVTTRNSTVALVMNSSQSYHLELMSNEEALSLFAQHVLDKQNFDSHPTLKLYAEGIVKKCGRLPLALKTLGRVLRTKSSDDEWDELLYSEIWNLPNDGNILPALRLSYYDLPTHLKQMFAYCCLFPKDYMFDKDELVLLWMAEGFLYHSNGSK